MRRTASLTLAFATLLFARGAIAFTLQSESTWGGPDSDGADGIAAAPDGSTYLAGTTRSFGDPSAPPAIVLLKHAPDGSQVFEQGWQSSAPFSQDAAAEVAVTPDGSAVYVAGASAFDAVILKFDANGQLLWQRTWGGTGADAAADVALAADGAILVSGETRSFGAGEADAFVLKLDPEGNLLWERTWGTANVESPGRVAVGPDGTVHLVTTTLRSAIDFTFDAILVRFDALGDLVDQTAISAGEVLDARGGVTVAGDGSVYLAGGIQETTRNSAILDVALFKLGPDTALIWAGRWGGKSGDDPGDITLAPDGAVVVAGTTDSFGQGGGGDAFVLAVSPEGRGLDASVWGSTGLDRADGVAVAPDGTVSVGTTTEAPPYVVDRASDRVSRLRGVTVAAAQGAVGTPTGTFAVAPGTTFTPGGSQTFAGAFDIAVVKLLP